MPSPSRFFYELQRRSVFKVAAAYVVSGWLLLQVASIVIPAFELSEWFMRATLIALVAGFPVACMLAWAYELTAGGIHRDDGDGSAPVDVAAERGLATWETVLVGVVMAAVLVGGIVSLYATRSAAPRHLAVLPFRVVSAHADADVLAAGLTETLTSTLTQFGRFEEALWVVPAAEITAPMTPSAARQRFGVSLVVSGSVQIDDAHVRLTVNLIDATTERQLYSRQIDVPDGGVIGLQDEATRQLSRMLDLRLSPRQASLLQRGRTDDPDAGRLYLEGRGRLRNATSVADVDVALDRFEKALSADSTFALAAAGLGEAYWWKYRRTEDVRWVDPALHHSRQALALDSTLAPAWITLGILRSDQRHDDAAITAFERALTLDPTAHDAHRHLAAVYQRTGDLSRAEAAYQRAIARQPEYWKGYNRLGVFYYGQGRYDEAIAQYTHGLRLAPANPSLLNNVAVAQWQMNRLDAAMSGFERLLAVDSTRISAQSNLATAYFYLGRFDEAAELYSRALAHRPKDYVLAGALADAQAWSSTGAAAAPATYHRAIRLAKEHLSVRGRDPLVLGSIAQYYARRGQTDSAQVWLRHLDLLVDPATTDVVTAFGIGDLYESIGDRTQALSWMQRALDRGYGWIPLSYSPWLASLRTDPRVRPLFDARPPGAWPQAEGAPSGG